MSMPQSESVKELATALAKAQAEMHGAKKNAQNPHFRSTFANLESVWEACREPLTKNGLSVVQTMDSDVEEGVCLVTTLLHTSGEWISGKRPLHAKNQDPQGIGSAITYARRYDLMALVGIAPEDDDAEEAMKPHRKPQAASPAPAPPKAAPKPPPAAPKAAAPENQGMPGNISAMYDWIIPFGKKFNGTRVGDVPLEDLISYAEWLEKAAHDKNKPLDGDFKIFTTSSRSFTPPQQIIRHRDTRTNTKCLS